MRWDKDTPDAFRKRFMSAQGILASQSSAIVLVALSSAAWLNDNGRAGFVHRKDAERLTPPKAFNGTVWMPPPADG